jgi:hypothetical protein
MLWIADGAAALGFRPGELELESLADAIDRMAARIAEGRSRLLAEKGLVERIVENVTAAVVGLDREGRVLSPTGSRASGSCGSRRVCGQPALAGLIAWSQPSTPRGPASGPSRPGLRVRGATGRWFAFRSTAASRSSWSWSRT